MHTEEEHQSRLSRLTAVLLHLQAGRTVSATFLAGKFGVSTRTIYRDIRALEQSGVPVVTEEGKGYSLMEGYRLAPLSFTEHEANALVTAEQLVLRNPDASFVKDYVDALTKVKAVLRHAAKDGAALLSGRIAVSYNEGQARSSHHLSALQGAITGYCLTDIAYQKEGVETPTARTVEPFALLSSEHTWMLAAKCRLRNDFRLFRLDRIRAMQVRREQFSPHKLTLEEYLLFLRSSRAAG